MILKNGNIAGGLPENSRRGCARRTSGSKQNKEDRNRQKFYQVFLSFKNGSNSVVQFQLDSNLILTSASKLKGMKLNTNIS